MRPLPLESLIRLVPVEPNPPEIVPAARYAPADSFHDYLRRAQTPAPQRNADPFAAQSTASSPAPSTATRPAEDRHPDRSARTEEQRSPESPAEAEDAMPPREDASRPASTLEREESSPAAKPEEKAEHRESDDEETGDSEDETPKAVVMVPPEMAGGKPEESPSESDGKAGAIKSKQEQAAAAESEAAQGDVQTAPAPETTETHQAAVSPSADAATAEELDTLPQPQPGEAAEVAGAKSTTTPTAQTASEEPAATTGQMEMDAAVAGQIGAGQASAAQGQGEGVEPALPVAAAEGQGERTESSRRSQRTPRAEASERVREVAADGAPAVAEAGGNDKTAGIAAQAAPSDVAAAAAGTARETGEAGVKQASTTGSERHANEGTARVGETQRGNVSRPGSGENPDVQGTTAADRVRLVQRVERAFHTLGEQGGSLRLRLSPPELGALRIELTVRQGEMTARLETETSAARNLLLDSLPALRERLAQQDIRVQRFDVDLMDRSLGGSPDHAATFADSRQRGDGGGGQEPRRSRGGENRETRTAAESTRARRPVESGRLNVII